MLEAIAYFVVPVFVILAVSYFVVEAQRKKVREQKKKEIIRRVSTIKNSFRSKMKPLVADKVLSPTGQEAVYRIANNFFVFQPVTIENISYCEQLLDRIVDSMPILNSTGSNLEWAQQRVSLFVRSLPKAASGYSTIFYQRQLPQLIDQLIAVADDTSEQQPAPGVSTSTEA